MRISLTSSKDDKFAKELQRLLREDIKPSDLQPTIQNGVEKLRVNTPKRSGVTANSWGSEISKSNSGLDVTITNSSVTSNGIPIPILIKNGHGTGTGGYVPPNDYITPVVDLMVKDVSSLIERKLR